MYASDVQDIEITDILGNRISDFKHFFFNYIERNC